MEKNYFVEFSPSLLKEERNLLSFLLKKSLKKDKLEFLLEDLDIPKLKNSKVLFLERFVKKGIYLIENEDRRVYCPYFDLLTVAGDKVILSFNNFFLEYLTNKEKDFKYYLKEVLFLKNSFSIDFFYKVIKKNILKNTLKVDVEKFKIILNLDSYDRLYDLKRFILIPLVEDISKNTDFKLDFKLEKIENKWFIVFYMKNKKIEIIKNYTQLFLKLYKHHIKDKNKMGVYLFNSIHVHGYDYIKSKILFSIKNKTKYNLNFDDILEKVLNDKLGEFYINLSSCEFKIDNIDSFRKKLHNELNKFNFSEVCRLDYNTNLTKELFKINTKEPIIINSENLKLELYYDPEGLSKIDIYKKYVKGL